MLWVSRVFAAAALVFVFAVGLAARRAVLDAQHRLVGRNMPFTMESALQFRRVKMIHDTGGLPAVDRAVQCPEGVRVSETYEIGPEYVQAWLLRLAGIVSPLDTRGPSAARARYAFGDRLRWIESGWFCLGIPLMMLWVVWRTGSWGGGLAAGLAYALSLSAISRSTGQELSHENFALPLLLGHLALAARAGRAKGRGAAVASAGSALLLAAAVATWDLIQFYLYLRAVRVAVRTLRTEDGPDDARREPLDLAAVLAVALFNPYHRSHGLIVSPALWVWAAALLLRFFERRRPASVLPGWARAGVLAGALAAAVAVGNLRPYGESYGQFASLLVAKLVHLNHKPADPSVLSFEQRILWTPALHSATWALTWDLFHAMGILSVVIALASLLFPIRRDKDWSELLTAFGVACVAFVFFVRFHVFAALFGAAVIGAGLAHLSRTGGLWRLLAPVAVAAACVIEAGHVVRHAERWGRPNVYYAELEALGRWLEGHAAPEPVLANFGVSGYIAAYGKCAVPLHPKFETAGARERIRRFGEEMFRGTERSLRDWAESLGARYLVYSYGEFYRYAPELQMRYMVNALDPGPDAPARLFEPEPGTNATGRSVAAEPERLRLFRPVWKNRKYGVFEILPRADEDRMTQLVRQARDALERGELDAAVRNAERALKYGPGNPEALEVIRIAAALRGQGFRTEDVRP